MGYRITMVMQKAFPGSHDFKGLVEFEKWVKDRVSDILFPNGEKTYEYYDEATGYVTLRNDFYELHFYENALEISTPDKWSSFFGNEEILDEPLLGVFQTVIDRIEPENCWFGTDYATIQGPGLEQGIENWLKALHDEEGEMEEFDFLRLKTQFDNDDDMKTMYHYNRG